MTLLAIFMAILSWGLSVSVHATCFFVRGNDERQTGFGIWTMQNVLPTHPMSISVKSTLGVKRT